jgi:hypothetical protein
MKARVYGVETRALNQALKRNRERFPEDFAFELTREEIQGISQTVISLHKLRFSKSVQAFTEHGALMAANLPHQTAPPSVKTNEPTKDCLRGFEAVCNSCQIECLRARFSGDSQFYENVPCNSVGRVFAELFCAGRQLAAMAWPLL